MAYMNRLKENCTLNLIVSAAVGLLLGAFMPLSTYMSNSQEFASMTSLMMLGIAVSFAIAAFILFFVLLCIISFFSKKVYGYAVMLISSLAVAIYAEGNIIGAKYPILDGKSIPWDKMIGVGIFNTAVWILIIGFGIFAYWKWKERSLAVLKNVMLALAGLMFVFGGLRFATLKPVQVQTAFYTAKDFFNVSSKQNIFVIVLDSFEQKLFEELLEKDPEVKKMLKDFTYYPNTIGKYPTTKGAMPHILTGMVNDNTYTYYDYLNKAFVQSELLRQANKSDYKVYFYVADVFSPHISILKKTKVENILRNKYSVSNDILVYRNVFQNSLFIYTPHLLKRFCLVDSFKKKNSFLPAQNNSRLNPNIATSMFASVGNQNKLKITTDKNVFKLYHLMGVHSPHYDLKTAKENIYYLQSFFNELKRLELYDKSAVVILADHGFDNGAKPLFLLKNNSEKSLAISRQPFGYDDLNHFFAQLLVNPRAPLIESRGVRSFLYYNWDDSWSSAHLPKMYEKRYSTAGKMILPGLDSYSGASFDELEASGFSRGTKGRWTTQRMNTLTIPLMEKFQNKNIVFTFDTSAFILPENPEQKVIFYVNDVKIKTEVYNYPARRRKNISLVIPNNVNSRDTLDLAIEVEKPVSPAEMKKSKDTRKLGLWITKLQLSYFAENVKESNLYLPVDLNKLPAEGMSVEPGGRWSLQTGQLIIPLKKELVCKQLDLFLDTITLVHPKAPVQEIDFFANQKKIKTVRYEYNKSSFQVVDLKIPSALNTTSLLTLNFKAKYALSPKKLGVSPDPRTLGVHIRKIVIQNAAQKK